MSFEKSFKKIFANVFFSQKVFLHLQHINHHFKTTKMKTSEKIACIVIVLGLFALAFYAVCKYVDTANAGFHGTF
jgi:cytosine/uracil/thiamine/allantoin permease